MNWPELLACLAEPFPPATIQWRAGATNREKTKAQALPYVDPREYERRLDALCPGEWALEFQPWGERIICELTIHGVTRSSTGESDGEGFAVGTAAEAQAFKRACSKFGLGRHLYDLPAQWVAYDVQKKRLLETPRLPGEPVRRPAPARAAQPQPASAPGRPGAAIQREPQQAPAPTLSRDRAQKMLVELGRLGFSRDEHYELAGDATLREVESLTALTEAEALKTLNLARRIASRRAAAARAAGQVSDEDAGAVLN